MSLQNLNSNHLTATQWTEVKTALTALEQALNTMNVNLTPEDRQKYGSVNELNKLLINKVHDYRTNEPDLSAADIDWAEFEKDYESRRQLESAIARLEKLVTQLKNAKVLHDYDNYQDALTDYSYASYKMGSASPGYETKHAELRQFFVKARPQTPPAEQP